MPSSENPSIHTAESITSPHDPFRVSVVIPVYKAGKFIDRAVARVLEQPEVSEVILMEDGSPDDSLQRCEALATRFPQVKVYQHPDRQNHGAGETRNAAIRHTTQPFVAFADADNLYLPGRFLRDREVFAGDPTIDGVYNAQGIHYESEAAREKFVSGGLGFAELLTVSERVPPEQMLNVMLGRHPSARMIGGLGIDAITLRRRCFDKAGDFDKRLRLQQDVHFFMKLAASCRMAPSCIETPVALRGVHENMRSTDPQAMARFRRMRWQLFVEWADRNLPDRERLNLIHRAWNDFRMRDATGLRAVLHLAVDSLRQPGEVFRQDGRFDRNVRDVLGRNGLTLRLLSLKNRMVRRIGRGPQPPSGRQTANSG
jgi:glycosyltransferase involved in cell wall biosynthesis